MKILEAMFYVVVIAAMLMTFKCEAEEVTTVVEPPSIYAICETEDNFSEFFLSEQTLSEEQVKETWGMFEKAALVHLDMANMEANEENIEIMAQVSCVTILNGMKGSLNLN